jgi:HEAT repeat protein
VSDVDRLLRALDEPTKRAQRAAAEALGHAGSTDPGLRTRLAGELDRGSATRQWLVAYALFLAGDRSEHLWPVLVASLASDDGDLRWAAARLLVALELPDLTERLIAAVAAGGAEQRKMALYCLRERGERTPGTEAAVVTAVGDPNAGVRLAAISTATVAVSPAAAARAVAARLQDADVGVRRAAAATLGRIGVAAPDVVAALERAAQGTDDALARAARGALARLGAAGGC